MVVEEMIQGAGRAGRLRGSRGAFSLVEVLIAAVILSIITLPVALMLSSSTGTVKRVDVQREVRLLMDQILERIETQDFAVLYDNFGTTPNAPGRIVEGFVKGSTDILSLGPILERMKVLNLTGSLTFRFFSKSEIGVDPINNLKTTSGVLWLQAGVINLSIWGGGKSSGLLRRPEINESLEKSIYCPLILGRPGLLINQCPAVDPQKKAKFISVGIP